jgi:hypothetical protein
MIDNVASLDFLNVYPYNSSSAALRLTFHVAAQEMRDVAGRRSMFPSAAPWR